MTVTGWADIQIGTLNLSDATPDEVVALMQGDGQPLTVLNLQEASDRFQVILALEAAGFGVIRMSTKTGMAATPQVFDPAQVEPIRTRVYLLHEGGDIGPGTGPDDGKPKYLQVTWFRHLESGRILVVANLHLYAGQAHPQRERLAVEMVQKVERILRSINAVIYLAGDFNTNPTSHVVQVLRDRRWSCVHDRGRFPTHGRTWRPDHIWRRDRWHRLHVVVRRQPRVRFTDARTEETRSDHRALIQRDRLRYTTRKRIQAARRGR